LQPLDGRRLWFVGIGGAGLSAYARLAKAWGAEVGGWDGNRYLFFIGCYYLLEGTIETFFLSNCTEFSDLVRSGDLDFDVLFGEPDRVVVPVDVIVAVDAELVALGDDSPQHVGKRAGDLGGGQ